MSEIIATAVIVSCAGAGLGIRWWMNRKSLHTAGNKLVSFTESLPPIVGCWLQILGEMHTIPLREGVTFLRVTAYVRLLRTLPAELQQWVSVEEAFERYADHAEVQNGRFGKQFPAMAWEALAAVCLERRCGGPFAIRHALHHVLQKEGWEISLDNFFGIRKAISCFPNG